jgi:hypothetical protein
VRRLSLSLIAVVATLAAVLVSPTPRAAEAAVPAFVPFEAQQADSVVDAYGVGIHLPFLDTPYADARRVADALEELGVRHVRDDLFLSNPRQYAGIRTVAERGIRFDLIMGRPDRPGTPADYVRTVASLPRGAVESVEGVNEWDLFGARRDWVTETVTWQKQLYGLVKSTPETAHLPVLSPALAFRQNYAALPNLTPWSDVANAHMYAGGYKPGTELGNITKALRAVLPTPPLVTTEAGYHNAIHTTNGHRPTSEGAAGVYLPRLLLEHVREGQKRLYTYELIDEFVDPAKANPEAHFGLLRRDWSPKPAYTAMKTLLGLLDDPGPAFEPTPLPLAVEGWPTDGRYLVTQKRDGSYVLLLYRDQPVWDPVARKELTVAPADVTLRFESSFDVAVHRVSEGPQPVSRTSGSAIQVPVDGGVTAITLTAPVPSQTPPPVAAPSPPDTPSPTATPQPAPTDVTEVPATAPGPARITATRTQGRKVTVTWRAAAPRGRAVERYRLRVADRTKVVGPGTTQVTFRGLPPRTKLRVTVQPRNAVGWGPVTRTPYVRTR